MPTEISADLSAQIDAADIENNFKLPEHAIFNLSEIETMVLDPAV